MSAEWFLLLDGPATGCTAKSKAGGLFALLELPHKQVFAMPAAEFL